MLEQSKDSLTVAMRSLAVMMLVILGTVLFVVSDSPAGECVESQSEVGEEIGTDMPKIVKSETVGKTYYYLEFVKQEGNEYWSSETIWLTVELGYVADSSEDFVVSDALYTSEETLIYGEAVQQPEFKQRSNQLLDAINVAESRYEAKVRATLLKLKQWLDSRTGPAPIMKESDIAALQELHKLKLKLFSDRYGDSSDDNPKDYTRDVADESKCDQ